MNEHRCSQSIINNCYGLKDAKKSKNDVNFDEIVKFLNDQKAVMDYAGLN